MMLFLLLIRYWQALNINKVQKSHSNKKSKN